MSIMERKGSAASASRTISSQLSDIPSACHSRRHSWISHSPIIFFSGRKPPCTVPSLEKPASRISSVSSGKSVSMPKTDHVPLEQKAKLPLPGIAATAEAVSWVPTAAKAAQFMPNSRAISERSLPRIVPGISMGGNIFSGRPKAAIMSLSQSRFMGL